MRTSGSSGTIKDGVFDFGFAVVAFVDGAVVVCTVVIEFLIEINTCRDTKKAHRRREDKFRDKVVLKKVSSSK